MTLRRVIVPTSVRGELDVLAEYIISISTPEHAERYTTELVAEIRQLSYLADSIRRSYNPYVLSFHPRAKQIPLRHGVLTAIFHVEGDFVIIDKLIPSKLIK